MCRSGPSRLNPQIEHDIGRVAVHGRTSGAEVLDVRFHATQPRRAGRVHRLEADQRVALLEIHERPVLGPRKIVEDEPALRLVLLGDHVFDGPATGQRIGAPNSCSLPGGKESREPEIGPHLLSLGLLHTFQPVRPDCRIGRTSVW